MIKKYFTYVPLWVSILVNVISGIIASGAFLLGIIDIMGLFSAPTLQEQIIGCLIMVGIVVGIILVNFVTYIICKRVSKKNETEVERKNTGKKLIVVLAILIVCVLSFFIFPDFWIAINSFWF